MDGMKIDLQRKIIANTTDKDFLRQELLRYYKLYGYDEFFGNYFVFIQSELPSIVVICLGCNDNYVNDFIKSQSYQNITTLTVKKTSNLKYIKDELRKLNGEYVTFLETDNKYRVNKLSDSLANIIMSPDDMVISYRNFINDCDEEIKDDTILFSGILRNKSFCGVDLLSLCESLKRNLCGNISSIMIDRTRFEDSIDELDESLILLSGENVRLLMRTMIKNCNIHFLNRAHILTKLKQNDNKESLAENNSEVKNCNFEGVKKEITFFYTDISEYYNLQPIADMAKKNGYKTVFTEDIYQEAEIGIYCQHECYPENSKFSVILLHDMAQGHNRWPNIWVYENWDKFDLGILPGKEWADRWSECACVSYVRPRYGAYMLGYPKSDNLLEKSIVEKASKIKDTLKYDFTVLYATSWENDNKEDDFVKAVNDLPINMVVKHAPVQEAGGVFQLHRDSVDAMRKMHEGMYDNLSYIDASENIFAALSLCDLVVSDESSVMIEAALYGKPSVAVTDWLIPDIEPHREASVPMNSVCKCKKADLRKTVKRMIDDKAYYDKYRRLGEGFFANKGHCCKDILSLIDGYLFAKPIDERITKLKIYPKYEITSI